MSQLKVLFIPVDHWGHINPCIGIGEQLVSQGHRAIIALEKSWHNKIPTAYPGIEEALYVDPTRVDATSKANEFWLENMKSRTRAFGLETFNKLRSQAQIGERQISRFYILLNVDQELKRIIDELKPNVIVVDCFVTVPAVYHSGIPWVRLYSGAPLSIIKCDELPPPASGLPTNGDRVVWDEYRALKQSLSGAMMDRFHQMMQRNYHIPRPSHGTAHISPYLNIYAYPEELDYLHIRPLPANFRRFDHFIRFSENDSNFVIPGEFLTRPNCGKLIFVSMGSMGSVDLTLMERLVQICALSPNRFIFALGPAHDQLKLAPNMWGAKFVPQTRVLENPLVDLVITHGGNNTVLETLYYGKPMIINPLFAEQPENAQRISECGLGHRVNVYKCEPQELLDKIEDLLSNVELKKRLERISHEMQHSNSTQQAAIAIASVAQKMSSKTVLFITVDMIGHMYPAIAIAEQLVALGNRAIFAVEQSWKGKISCYKGIEEVLYVDPTRDPTTQAANEKNLQGIKELIKNFPFEGIERQKRASSVGWNRLLRSLLVVDDELKKIIYQVKPNAIVVDHFSTIPAVFHSGIPWVRMGSAAPLSYVGTDDLPPACSGLPTNGNRDEWNEYRRIGKSIFDASAEEFHSMMLEKYNIPHPPPGRGANNSPYLNIYAYPEELDYLDIRPLPDKWQRFDHFVRLSEVDPNFKLPDELLNSNQGKLVYVSLGSMGSADLDLMKRLIEILAKSPNRFIFSLGPYHEELLKLLPHNMWGSKFMPQTQILVLVDLVITHGGNNSVLETLYFGKPMIVCPLFADQHENAQRLSELGLGHRINAYKCAPEDLLAKVEELLHNPQLQERLERVSHKMQQSKAPEKAARAIIAIAN